MTDPSTPSAPSASPESPASPASTQAAAPPADTGSGQTRPGPGHPGIDADAVARLRERTGAPSGPPTAAVIQPPVVAASKLKATARRAVVPVVGRVRNELDRAASGEVAALRAEVADLRTELTRLRAELEAVLAAVREDRR